MLRLRSVLEGLFVIGLVTTLINGDSDVSAGATVDSPGVQVRFAAPQTTTSWDANDSDRTRFDLPLLYLHRGRETAPPTERTLEVTVSGLSPATEIRLALVSHHADAATGEPHSETQTILLPDVPSRAGAPCTFVWTLSATMPSDLYHLQVQDAAGNVLWENPYPERPDIVALDTWDVALGDYVARITYATLFPFAKGQADLENRLSLDAVTDFVQGAFAAIIQDTWHTQFEEWGFGDALHPDWDLDKVIDIIITDGRFALFDEIGPFTMSFDSRGRPHSQRCIWWKSDLNNFQAYDSLENAYRAVFAHEFFHLAQWNVRLSTGQPENRWLNVFIEAQGKFAPTVQVPELEMRKDHVLLADSEYASAANHFLTHGLNSSYQEMDAGPLPRYDAALYWRFLYEQFHDMGVVQAALEAMAEQYDADIVGSIGHVMNQTFAHFDGPFRTFEESVIAFAQANYALRLEGGRCTDGNLSACGGVYYDPDRMYVDPPLEAELNYDGVALSYRGAIPSSYGMDFIELKLDPNIRGQSTAIVFRGEGAVADFNLQIWKLRTENAQKGGLRAVTVSPDIVPRDSDGAHVYVIPQGDTETYERLALLITRLDPDETAGPEGLYQLTVGNAHVP